jgi:putative aldouronate transport system permease protein
MKKRKPYSIIITVLFLASVIVSLFLPYLHLPEQDNVSEGYEIDFNLAVLESNIINKVAKEENIKKTIVYSTAKNILNGKSREDTQRRLKEEEYYIIDLLAEELNEAIADMQEMGKLEKRDYSFSEMIKLSISVIDHMKQDIISSCLLIFSMIMTVILSIASGLNMGISKKLKKYTVVKVTSVANIALSLIGLISINAISIGALQVDNFYKSNWGQGFFAVMIINFVIWVLAVIGHLHEKYEGLVTWKMILKQRQLLLMSIPFVIYAFIFYYSPLVGWIMAFQNYKPAAKGNQIWIGWNKFVQLFTDADFIRAFRNTVAMSMINLVLSFIFAIGFALLLNEVVNMKGKKFVQTISYLPHFLSWVIVAAIVRNALSIDGGMLNELLVNVGIIDSPINFFADPKYFWWIVGFAFIWKETGWNSIIYLASITSINPELYEAASIDGAGRLRKMLHITLPGIKATIFVLLIINLGMIMNSGFEAQYQLDNDIIKSTSEVIDIYVLNKSFHQGTDWSIGTAAGIFKSVVSIILVSLANRSAKFFDQERLY